jgi:small-conductance mechanosensitive channel
MAAAPGAATTRYLELPDWTPEQIVTIWRALERYPWMASIALVVLSFLLAKLIEVVLFRVLAQLSRRTKNELDDRVFQRLHRPVFVTIFFFGLVLAVHVLNLPRAAEYVVGSLLLSMVVFVWLSGGFAVERMVLTALARNHERFRLIEERTIPLLEISIKLILVAAAGYALLAIWRVDPTPWLASAGILGIALGFAAKDTLANLFSGIFIVADAPYKIGDWINLDSGERGRVTQVGIRSTRLLTRDDIEIILPNSVIANAKIINESGGPWEKERIRIKVGVAYGTDLDRVCEVLEGIAVGHEHICADPTPRVRMRAFGDSGIDFELLCWIDEPVLRGKLSHALYMETYRAFQREGIEIPYPKRDVYIKESPGS